MLALVVLFITAKLVPYRLPSKTKPETKRSTTREIELVGGSFLFVLLFLALPFAWKNDVEKTRFSIEFSVMIGLMALQILTLASFSIVLGGEKSVEILRKFYGETPDRKFVPVVLLKLLILFSIGSLILHRACPAGGKTDPVLSAIASGICITAMYTFIMDLFLRIRCKRIARKEREQTPDKPETTA